MRFDPFNFDPEPARGKIEKVTQGPFICEAKLDGVRQVLMRHDGELTMTGRRTSVVTGHKLNKIDWVPDLKKLILSIPSWWNIVLDGELYIPRRTSNEVTSIFGSGKEIAWDKQRVTAPLHFRVFDILSLNEEDLRQYPLVERKAILMDMLTKVDSTLIRPVPVFAECDGSNAAFVVEDAYDQAIRQGFEGLVVKSSNGMYDKSQWAKVKPVRTFDYVFCGIDESTSETYAGWGAAALKLGLYTDDGELIPVTRCSGMTEYWRSEFFKNWKTYVGQTVEVEAQQQFPTGALRHPRFKKLRPDVSSSDQTTKKYDLVDSDLVKI